MWYLFHRAITIYQKEGLLTLTWKIKAYLQEICLSLIFYFYHRFYSAEKYIITISLRKSSIDSDVIAILDELSRRNKHYLVYVVYDNKYIFSDRISPIIKHLEKKNIEIEYVQNTSLKTVHILSKSSKVFEKDNTLARYRHRDANRDREYISLSHGLVTKPIGNHQRDSNYVIEGKSNIFDRFQRSIDVRSVNSEIEKFYMSSAYGWDPKNIKEYGYPRFDRITKLKKGISDPVLPTDVKKELEEDKYNILYAPTRRQNDENTFPFTPEEVSKLHRFLDKYDMRLFIRMHTEEEADTSYRELINGETVCYGGRYASPASSELLPYMDLLVTDYSSIYMEYLLFDRPIVFFRYDHQSYVDEYGESFDYDRYFPGKKAENLNDLVKKIRECKVMGDELEEDREFVRRTFFPKREKSYFELVLPELEEDEMDAENTDIV